MTILENFCANKIHLYQSNLLQWYDENGRDLPWRAKAPETPNPYHVLLSEFMLQQTQVATVKAYFTNFITKWPSIADLANEDIDVLMAAWAGLGYYARARNLHKAARMIMEEYDGIFPQSAAELIKLAGIGPYTAAAIASIGFDQAVSVVDGNIERIIMRLSNDHGFLEDRRKFIRIIAAKLTPKIRAGDYAQALMDLGAMVCRPANPDCPHCPLQDFCAGFAADKKTNSAVGDLPKRKPKPKRPKRIGTAALYYYERQGEYFIYLQKRPNKGLLGGTIALPSSPFTFSDTPETPPHSLHAGHNGDYLGQVTHIFTHFSLNLHIYGFLETGEMPSITESTSIGAGKYYPLSAIDELGLSSLMRKAILHALHVLTLMRPSFVIPALASLKHVNN